MGLDGTGSILATRVGGIIIVGASSILATHGKGQNGSARLYSAVGAGDRIRTGDSLLGSYPRLSAALE